MQTEISNNNTKLKDKESDKNNQRTQNQLSNINQHILFLSDLPNNITEDDLRSFFKDYNERIKLISITPSIMNTFTKKLKSPTATILFTDSKSSEKAKKDLNLKKMKGKSVRIMWHTKDKNVIENTDTNIYIKNIPKEVSPREVLDYFAKYGEIISAKIPENEEGYHFGFGYINFAENESARKAIDLVNGKKVWNHVLEVQPFIKIKDRATTVISNNSSTIYLKEFPEKFIDENIKEICRNLGEEVVQCKIINDKTKPPNCNYAVIIFSNSISAEKVKNGLNNMQIEGRFLKAENYKTKGEKYSIDNDSKNDYLNMNYYIHNQNNQNNVRNQTENYLFKNQNQFNQNNNLLIKNIPFDATESDLKNCFSKYGEIKSVKIEKINLVTKVNEEYKEIPTSQGFGYVSFNTYEEAEKAKEAMNGKYLPKFEMWKRPLLICFFIPKNQRNNYTYTHPDALYTAENPQNTFYSPNYIGNFGPLQQQHPETQNINMNFNLYAKPQMPIYNDPNIGKF
jgi:polyadenylate-binding protein